MQWWSTGDIRNSFANLIANLPYLSFVIFNPQNDCKVYNIE